MFQVLISFFIFCGGLSASESVKLVVMRHGHAENNEKRLYNSNPRHPTYIPCYLTPLGEEQARLTAQQLLEQGVNAGNVDRVIVSPLPRTQQTASILVEEGVASKNAVIVDERLIELQRGNLEGQVCPPSDREKLHDHSDAKKYGGETEADVRERVTPLLKELAREKLKGHVILVTHGTIGQEILRIVTGNPQRPQTGEAIVVAFEVKTP